MVLREGGGIDCCWIMFHSCAQMQSIMGTEWRKSNSLPIMIMIENVFDFRHSVFSVL